MPRAVLFALLALIPFLPGCFTESPVSLADTQGVVAYWTCEDGACDVEGATIDPPACGGRDRWVVGAGAVAILCAAREDERGELAVRESTCRPLACDDELDCPQWEDLVYGCDSGVCTTDRFALDALDVRAACLRRVARALSCDASDSDPDTAARTAIAARACPDARTCAIPEECLE